ncbi:MAG: hypothetical protein H8E34_07865 [Bacteroidetes bacterium]|nr:hypothetical protein [Bacteroidota bacterium]
MREIKFRAWSQGLMLTMPIYGYFGLSRFFGFLKDGDNIMQYTGLKDKNGKEIYDGDILEFEIPDYCYDFSVEKKSKSIIFWDDSSAAFMEKDINGKCLPDDMSGDMMEYSEVIGNIHQTPELLEV